MNERIKNYLGIAGALGIIVFAGAAWNYAGSYSQAIDPGSLRSFSVSGEGKVVAVPDVAQFSFTVLTEGGSDLVALQEENTKKMNTAIAFVKEGGIKSADIKTQQYNISPRYKNYNCYGRDGGTVCPPPEIVGYTIQQSVLVKVRDFAVLGPILSGVVESGANSVSSPSFTIDDPSQLEDEAREEAIAQAKEKARAIAKAGGFSLGRLLSIDEGGRGYPMPMMYATKESFGIGGADTAYSQPPTIEPGSEDTIIYVTLRYEIR